MTRSIISTLAAAALIGFAGLLSAATSQAATEGWGGLTVAFDTDNGPSPEGYGPQGGFAPVVTAEYDFGPAAIEEVSLSPSVGRIVHFTPWASETNGSKQGPGPVAAMITDVHSDTCVNLKVFWDDAEIERATSVPLDAGATPTPGTWRWPERVA